MNPKGVGRSFQWSMMAVQEYQQGTPAPACTYHDWILTTRTTKTGTQILRGYKPRKVTVTKTVQALPSRLLRYTRLPFGLRVLTPHLLGVQDDWVRGGTVVLFASGRGQLLSTATRPEKAPMIHVPQTRQSLTCLKIVQALQKILV